MMRKRKGHPVYPLTAAQKFHFFYQNFCPKKEVLNIGTSLTIEMELDMELLKKWLRLDPDLILAKGKNHIFVSKM